MGFMYARYWCKALENKTICPNINRRNFLNGFRLKPIRVIWSRNYFITFYNVFRTTQYHKVY